jgi:RNA polymerase sigma factor (TIGR02999 family)
MPRSVRVRLRAERHLLHHSTIPAPVAESPAPPRDSRPNPPISCGMHAPPDVTELISSIREGEPRAWERLVPVVYEELRRIARRQLRSEACGHTLNTTALVHEAYLKLAAGSFQSFADRAHFFAVAARAMRQIVIDHARRHRAEKRGGAWKRIPLEAAEIAAEERAEMLLALDEALTRLTSIDERLGQVVECRFFGGMTEEETAVALEVTDRTVRRDWTKARLWLYDELSGGSA